MTSRTLYVNEDYRQVNRKLQYNEMSADVWQSAEISENVGRTPDSIYDICNTWCTEVGWEGRYIKALQAEEGYVMCEYSK